MSRSDTARRGISLVLAVLCLLVVPGLASAAFTNRQPVTVGQSVGTASLTAPTAIRGSYACDSGFLTIDTLSIQVSGVVAANPSSVDYEFQLVLSNSVQDSVVAPDATSPVTLNGQTRSFIADTVWRLQARPLIHQWTGPWFSKEISCPAVGNRSGAL